jgi:uncharacterized protein with von Willebrand factor type A (vWA) domain
MSNNAMNRLQQKISAARDNFAGRGGFQQPRKQQRQFTRQVVKVSKSDSIRWTGNRNEDNPLFTLDGIEDGIRNDPEVDAAISDLFYGDTNNPEERPPYLNAPELLQDIFMIFLKAQPDLYKKHEVKKDARLNQKFIVQTMELPAYEEIHDYTMTDPQTSKDAVLAFVDIVKEMVKQHREAVEEANKQREEDGTDPKGKPGNQDNKIWDESDKPKGKDGKPSKDGQGGGQSPGANQDQGKSQAGDKEPGEDEQDDEGQPQQDWDYHDLDEDEPDKQDGEGDESEPEGGEGSEGGDGDGDGDESEAQLDDIDREFNEDASLDDYEDESDWESMVDNIDFGRLANQALESFGEEQRDLDSARKGVGLDDAEWKMMDPKARMDIAKRLNTPRMKQIADMVGRMKRFAMSKQAQKIIDAPHEIFTVEMGNDLRRVLRSEYALLGTPETKIEFYRRYVNGELLQYKERGHEDVGKGPIICCIDNSGSMGGAPENWAKGVAEALRRICQDQDRDFHAIYFETNRHRERFDFPKGKGPFEKIMAFLGISAGGGTEFDGVLTEALTKAKDFFAGRPEHGKSDIVFVTDGEAYLNDDWIEKFNADRKEAGVRVFSVFISAYDSSRGSAMKLLERFSDMAIPVKALEVNDEASAELFTWI